MKSTRSPKKRLSQTYEVRNPDSIDDQLKTIMSNSGYDELIAVLRQETPQFYKASLSMYCSDLILNAKKVGSLRCRRIQSPSRRSTPSKNCQKDPNNMTDAELLQSNMELEKLIAEQREYNAQLREQLQFLDPVMRRLDLEKQCVFIELLQEETQLTATSS